MRNEVVHDLDSSAERLDRSSVEPHDPGDSTHFALLWSVVVAGPLRYGGRRVTALKFMGRNSPKSFCANS